MYQRYVPKFLDMAEKSRLSNASMEQLQEIKDMLAGGASYYAIEKKYGYNRNVVRSWWLALEDKERKMAAINNYLFLPLFKESCMNGNCVPKFDN